MKKIVCLSILTFLIYGSPVFAAYKTWCSDNWACAGADKNAAGEIIYWLENRKPYPITVTLSVTTSNLKNAEGKVQRHWEVTEVLTGTERKNVLHFSRVKPNKISLDEYEFTWIPGDMHVQHNNSYRYQLPFAESSDYRVVQGYNGNYSHSGASRYALDFAMPVGTPIHAAREGVVIDLEANNWRGGASRRFASFANFITVLHDDGTTGEYYHLKQNGVLVSVGDSVAAGDLIGYSGNTGFSSLPHLHFAVYKAKSHGAYQSIPIQFQRKPNTMQRRGIGSRD